MSDDLVVFLTACLDEDEAMAQSAGADSGMDWRLQSEELPGMVVASNDEIVVYDEGRPTQAEADHIARYDPARVLAEVAAKRTILALHGHAKAGYSRELPGFGCVLCADDRDYGILALGWCDTLRHVAAVYRNRPGYRDEWKP